MPLGDPIAGNAYEIQESLPAELQFPTNLRDATALFNQSKETRDLFGDEFVDHYVSSRDWEVREYEKFVTNWQLQRYFEII